MRHSDFENPDVVERWCGEQRAHVENFLRERVEAHGPIAASPAWHAAPYLALWSAEGEKAGKIAWWVVCGNVPTDFVSAKFVKDAREALQTFAARWQRLAAAIRRREDPPELAAVPPGDRPQLAKLLAEHADLMLRAAADDSAWSEDPV